MDLKRAIKHAIDGNAVLFAGSGYSGNATPVGHDEFLTGRKLAKFLYVQSGITTDDDQLNYAAQAYVKKFDKGKLLSILKSLFVAKDVSDCHVRLASIPWQSIFTTNYDNVIELSYERAGRALTPLTPQNPAKDHVLTSSHCLHINGYIPSAKEDDLDNNIKLSNSSYLTEAFANSPWGFAFRKSIEYSKSIIFIGYSMYDIDIQRIIFNTSGYRDKIIFIEREGLDEDTIEYGIQSEFGQIYPIGIDKFIEEFLAVKENHIPVDDKDTIFNFVKIDIKSSSREFRDDTVFDLFLRGQGNFSTISDSLRDDLPGPYFVKRQAHDDAMQAIANGENNFLLHGDMANGKSAATSGLLCALAALGYDAYQLEKEGVDLSSDIRAICTRPGKSVTLIENATRHFDDIKLFCMLRSQDDILIGTTKTSFFESRVSEFTEAFGNDDYFKIPLDFLYAKDIELFANLMSTYKFWGSKDSLSDFAKARYIAQNCDSQLSGLLLDIIKSPNIRKKFDDLFEKINEDSDLGNIVISACVLLVLDFRITEFMLSELSNSTLVYKPKFSLSEELSEIFTRNNGKISFRSSIVARYGLTEHPDSRKLVDQLIKIAERAHERKGHDGLGALFFDVYKSLVTFSVVQSMLPEKGKRDALIRFYENVKNLDAAKNHPHFWLQYALARLSYDDKDDLEKAKLYLDTAYARASKIDGYHTRHMDNAYARYLVKKAISEVVTVDAFKLLKEANTILIRQARTEKNHMSYRVARSYSAFYSSHRNSMSQEQRNELEGYSKDLIELIPRLNLDSIGKREVEICKRELESIIADQP
ncbi:SIR2 family protein [Sphingopyxis sp. OPL5]|uniref:SIR2 family protein n=1 Tax=Sphingopyxis sp. OPL5 TaxID=2486273 RepID=UPI00164D9807|nr:SIR2 family protein [Sphingopyxis sp. OPL5]QNO28245.1 SIR2 family protein [Sphingopyxis sp. OPL5]